MPLHHPSFSDLAIEVADCASTGYKQKIRRLEIGSVPFGSAAEIRLDTWLTAYKRLDDGSYGPQIPFTIVPERYVPLVARRTVAVGSDKVVPLFELIHDLGAAGATVLNRQTQEQYTIPAGQTWEQWLDARPEDLWLQHEILSEKRDSEPICMLTFALWQVRAADLAPSSFA